MALLSTKKDRNSKLTKFYLKIFSIDFNLYFVLNKIIVVFNKTSKLSQVRGYFFKKLNVKQEKKIRYKDIYFSDGLNHYTLTSSPNSYLELFLNETEKSLFTLKYDNWKYQIEIIPWKYNFISAYDITRCLYELSNHERSWLFCCLFLVIFWAHVLVLSQ